MHFKHLLPLLSAVIALAHDENTSTTTVSTTNESGGTETSISTTTMTSSFSMSYMGPATTASGLPRATWHAVLPSHNSSMDDSMNHTHYPLEGNLTITSAPGRPGVQVSVAVNLTMLPPDLASLGDIAYHVHVSPIPANGNCSAAGAHLDPTYRGDKTVCEPMGPEGKAGCQIGDLSGKEGNITVLAAVDESSGVVMKMYNDSFLSTKSGDAGFVGGRSVVWHAGNGTRIACANLTEVMASGGGGDGMATSTMSGSGGMPSATGAGQGGDENGGMSVGKGGLWAAVGMGAVAGMVGMVL